MKVARPSGLADRVERVRSGRIVGPLGQVRARRFRATLARWMKSSGLTNGQIGEVLGNTRQTIRNLIAEAEDDDDEG